MAIQLMETKQNLVWNVIPHVISASMRGILEIFQGVLIVLLATISVIIRFNNALNLVLMVYTSPLPQNVNFAVLLARHVTTRPKNALPVILIMWSTGISLKISALKAVPLSSLMSVPSAENVMQSATLASTVLHSVFPVTHHLNISSCLAMNALKSVQKGPSQIIKDWNALDVWKVASFATASISQNVFNAKILF
jgi:hypothetical protein